MASEDDYSYSAPQSGGSSSSSTLPIHNRSSSSMKKDKSKRKSAISNISNTNNNKAPSTNASSQTYLLFIGTCLFVTMTGNFLHHHIADPHNVHKHAMMNFEMQHLGGHAKLAHEEKKKIQQQRQIATANGILLSKDEDAALSDTTNKNSNEKKNNVPSQPLPHDLAGLSCADHGGPISSSSASEMVYWEDIPSDAMFKSPIGNDRSNRKYLTFEPDGKFFIHRYIEDFFNASYNMQSHVFHYSQTFIFILKCVVTISKGEDLTMQEWQWKQ